jgi:beta-N-acetylhexosaminidase
MQKSIIALAVFLVAGFTPQTSQSAGQSDFEPFTSNKPLGGVKEQAKALRTKRSQHRKILKHNNKNTADKKNRGIVQDLPLSKLDRMIGQMIVVGFRGTSVRDRGVRIVLRQLREGKIGGVILMGYNIRSRNQLRALTSAFRQASWAGGQIPFVSVDQEGGIVQRLQPRNGYRRYPTPKKIGTMSKKAAFNIYSRLACQLHDAGINVNFGPTVDLDLLGYANPIIGRLGRSFSKNPKRVVAYARQFIKAHQRFGISTVLKHFPGHGSSRTDSHETFTPIPGWNRKNELYPYRLLAKGGRISKTDQIGAFIKNLFKKKNSKKKYLADMVMVGHLYNKKFSDGNGVPASLSKKAIKGLLRKDVGFKGVVISDDMEMGAVIKKYKRGALATRIAVNAGNDIILYSNYKFKDPIIGDKIHKYIKSSICKTSAQKSCIKKSTIKRAYRRIMRLKNNKTRSAAFNKRYNCSKLK